jgi:hypothetical protein
MKLLGLGFLFIFFIMILVGAYLDRKGSRLALREISAFKRLKREIGLAVEGGKKLHLTIGHGGISDVRAGSGLIGLSLLSRIARIATVSDHPPVVSSGDALLAILAQDTMKGTYSAIGAENLYDLSQSQLSGLTPFAYAAGAMPIVLDKEISVDILAGNFGVEAGLIADAVQQSQGVAIGGSDNLSAQAVMYAALEDVLIGEELFASGAYLQTNTWHRSSVRAQDIMRWIVIGALLIGAVLKIAGVL